MALSTTGSVLVSQINTEFGLGNSLIGYRNQPYFVNSTGVKSTFSSSSISMNNFRGTSKTSPLTITYPSSCKNGKAFTWSIAKGVPGDGWWATSNSPNHSTFGSSGTPYGYLNSSGTLSYSDGSFSPDVGTWTVNFFFSSIGYGQGTFSKTITSSAAASVSYPTTLAALGDSFTYSITNGFGYDSVNVKAYGFSDPEYAGYNSLANALNYGNITLDSSGFFSTSSANFGTHYGTITTVFTFTNSADNPISKTIIVPSY
jgi:hypothetical protein